MAKIVVEREKCIGCGTCAALCPKYFEMIDDGKSHIKNSARTADGNDELETEKVECANTAAESCPVQCIKIT